MRSLFVICAGIFVGHVAIAAPDIQPPQRRAQSVELAGQFSKTATPEELAVPDGLRNPFNPAAIEVAKTVRPTSDKDVLTILSDRMEPTGVMGRDDDMVLLLKGQKGVKVGERLTLSFDGSNYEVEITAIDRKNFSLRYNQAEISRPIKAGKNP